jgi:dephospho-CoA kinase
VGEAFPGAVKDGRVDREALRQAVLGDPEALKRLNAIVHPLVGRDRIGFFQKAEADGADMVVLDIPLLFETGGHANVDAVVVASAPADMQRQRVLARPGMTPERLDAILAQQLADADKRARAHFVVDTSRGLAPAREQVAEIIAAMRDPQRRPVSTRQDAPATLRAVELPRRNGS